MKNEQLTCERLRNFIVERFELDANEVDEGTAFVTDLGFDSLRMVELFLALGELDVDVVSLRPEFEARLNHPEELEHLTVRRLWELIS